ncbi:MAG: TetR/AcrR family transcriptional regulator [Victivallaceae bacterium]|nr:TetR/AcrR family transcriptional regulator [Victivallaceae bacterium]
MGISARRRREKECRRQNILTAARTVFRQQGFSGTTIRQIAALCELAPGTIYLYFPDKTHIFAALLLESYDLLISKLNAAVAGSPGRQRGVMMVRAFFDFALAYPENFNLVFFMVQSERRGVLDVFDHGSDIYQRLRACKAAGLELIAETVRSMRPDLNEEQVIITAETAWSMLAGVVYYFAKDGPAVFQVIAAQAEQMLLACIEHVPVIDIGLTEKTGG